MVQNRKAKTLIERFGFQDRDLTTPDHDEILLWLLEKKNCWAMLASLGLIKQDFMLIHHHANDVRCDWNWKETICSGICSNSNSVDINSSYAKESIQAALANLRKRIHEKSVWEYLKVEAEYPIMSGNNWNIGFVDLHVALSEFDLSEVGGQYGGYGYRQTLCSVSWPISENHVGHVYVEIKPKVFSIGELIRQINFYRSHKEGHWVVATTSTNVKDILKTQNILVYEYKREEKKEIELDRDNS